MHGQDPRRARMHQQKGKMGSKGKVAKYRELKVEKELLWFYG